MLALLEGEQLARGGQIGRRPTVSSGKAAPTDQLALFASAPNPLVEKLASLDVNTITPLEALGLLATLAAEAKAQH